MIYLMNLDDVQPMHGYQLWDAGRTRIDDVEEYVWGLLQADDTLHVMFGIDSQVQGNRTNYVIALVFHSTVYRNGGHVIYKRIEHQKFGGSKSSILEKLSLEATTVFDEIKPFVKMLRQRGFDQWSRLKIHVDFNTQDGTGSNAAYKSHVGWLGALGLDVHVKPQSFAALAADKILKPGGSGRRTQRRFIRKQKRAVRKRTAR